MAEIAASVKLAKKSGGTTPRMNLKKMTRLKTDSGQTDRPQKCYEALSYSFSSSQERRGGVFVVCGTPWFGRRRMQGLATGLGLGYLGRLTRERQTKAALAGR